MIRCSAKLVARTNTRFCSGIALSLFFGSRRTFLGSPLAFWNEALHTCRRNAFVHKERIHVLGRTWKYFFSTRTGQPAQYGEPFNCSREKSRTSPPKRILCFSAHPLPKSWKPENVAQCFLLKRYRRVTLCPYEKEENEFRRLPRKMHYKCCHFFVRGPSSKKCQL